MAAARTLTLILMLGLLPGCEPPAGKEAGKSEIAQNDGPSPGGAEGKAKEGQFSIEAPGVEMKIDIPSGVTSHGNSDSDLLYPGSTLSGMHIEGRRGSAEGKGNAGIELRFTTKEAPEKVAAWYRDPARSTGFTINSVRREAGAILIAGAEKEDGDPFSLRLAEASGGGTEGRLTLSDRN